MNLKTMDVLILTLLLASAPAQAAVTPPVPANPCDAQAARDDRWVFHWSSVLKGVKPESAAAIYTDFDHRKEITPHLEISRVLLGGQTACVLVEYLFRSLLTEHSTFWNRIEKTVDGYLVQSSSDGPTTHFDRSCQATRFKAVVAETKPNSKKSKNVTEPKDTLVEQDIYLVGPPAVGELLARKHSKDSFDSLVTHLARPANPDQLKAFRKKLVAQNCTIPSAPTGKNPALTEPAKEEKSSWPSFHWPR